MEGEITCNQSTAKLKSEGGDRQGKPKSKEISLEEQKAEMKAGGWIAKGSSKPSPPESAFLPTPIPIPIPSQQPEG